MSLKEYVQEFYGNDPGWLQKETNDVSHNQRIRKIFDIQDYLDGKHKILNKKSEMYGGKEFHPRKIVLQYGKQILNFQVSYLISNPLTLSGSEKVVNEFKKIYKKGKFHRQDFKIINYVTKYGHCFEYLYFDENRIIKSKLIKPENSYPIFNDENEMIGFIEHYTSNAVSYWNIYDNNKVLRYTNRGGSISLLGEYRNVSGLPIHYHNQSEVDDNFGRSDLEDIVSLIDTMEDILSKLVDSYHKFHTPIPVITGQQITDGALSNDIAGTGLTLEDGSTFSLETSKLDYQSFQTIWKTLMQSMLDVSGTPSVSMNQGTTANIAEVSIKMLYTLADMRAAQNEIYFRDGLYDRFDKIKLMLEYLNVSLDDEDYDTLDVVFQYARPLNESDVINNLQVLAKIGGISLKSLLERNPYIVDVVQELERLKGSKRNKNDTVNERMKDNLTENESKVIENV
ncbi:phage portal protein [Peribacillus loiseleuriae]|uniref:Phage portal protein n=1 Tax=Peribacillus loiseleuriae TaxID=1679170 RepID=A0A0K9GWC1_9BACI|nr:phage portal protein [Peribacillus loiseleuriae]KMY50547.1 hypothetical protein AC625_14390 [Peribacillus loiseleuriae]